MQQNSILSVLDSADRKYLAENARQISFAHGDIFCEAGSPIKRVIFPISGMISVVVELNDGDRIECAMVGVRGAIGGSVAFGGEEHSATAFCQIPGSCWTIHAAEVVALASRNSLFRETLFRQEEFLLAQAQQTAACNARHRLEERLATWLLRARDATGSDELWLTQEFLAQMLGVQRASVSTAAGGLAATGTIEYRRGRIKIVHPEQMADIACECHQTLAEGRRQLFMQLVDQTVLQMRSPAPFRNVRSPPNKGMQI